MAKGRFSHSAAEQAQLWRAVGRLAADYWRHAADDATPVQERRGRRRPRPLPMRPRPATAVLREAMRFLSRNACHLASPRYYGLMNPKPTLVGVLGDALASVLNPQLADEARAPGAFALEQEALGWFLRALGWGRGQGQFTSGGSEANLVGLKVALNARLPSLGRRSLRALRGQPVFYASEEAHHSLEKFAGLLGLGHEAVRWIPTDNEFAMRPDLLAAAVRRDRRAGRLPFCVVATFGTTSSGAIDPVGKLARFCRRQRLWLHVDGAYGGALVLSPRFRHLWSGIRLADSLTVDPHKWLAMPFALGAVLVRDARAMATPFRVHTAYMPRGTQRVENYQLGVQWSRRFLGLKFWLAAQVYGRRAYEAHFAEQMRLGRFFRERLAARGNFATFSESPLPITCFSWLERPRANRRGLPVESLTRREQQINVALAEDIMRRGWAWISPTRLRPGSAGARKRGVLAMRMMVINYETSERHLARLVRDLERLARDPRLRRLAARLPV